MRYVGMTRLLLCVALVWMGGVGCSDDSAGGGFEGSEAAGDAAGSGFEWNDTLNLPGGSGQADVDLGGGGGIPGGDTLGGGDEDVETVILADNIGPDAGEDSEREATDLRNATARRGGWLRRGFFSADAPWLVYATRALRVLRPMDTSVYDNKLR